LARSLATLTNATQAESATKTSLLKHSGVKQIQVEPKQPLGEQVKKHPNQKSRFKQDFSCIAVGGSSAPVIQPKLVVGQPDNRYEQEADRVADQVMRMPDPAPLSSKNRLGLAQPLPIQQLKADSSKKLQRQVEFEESDEETVQAKRLPSLSIEPLNLLREERVQRQADKLQEAKEEEDDEEEESEPVQAKFLSPLPIQTLNASSEERLQRQADESQEEQLDDEEEEEPVQTKGISLRTPKLTSESESRLKASRGGGQPLPDFIREFMESRFSYDFSRVRVHTDGQANELARSLNAQAFTFKQDIYFGAGYYQPHTLSGKRLLAHELTHTIQQQDTPTVRPHHPDSSPRINQPTDGLEREAEAAVHQAGKSTVSGREIGRCAQILAGSTFAVSTAARSPGRSISAGKNRVCLCHDRTLLGGNRNLRSAASHCSGFEPQAN
jgi:hypothetical protein